MTIGMCRLHGRVGQSDARTFLRRGSRAELAQGRLGYFLFTSAVVFVVVAGPVLAIDSWREPTALERAWCLLEIFTAITERCDVVMAFSRAEEASFVRQLVQNQAVVEATIGALDAQRAEATVVRDREMIFAAIRGGCGVDTFNDTVRETLRGSLQRIIIAQRSYF